MGGNDGYTNSDKGTFGGANNSDKGYKPRQRNSKRRSCSESLCLCVCVCCWTLFGSCKVGRICPRWLFRSLRVCLLLKFSGSKEIGRVWPRWLFYLFSSLGARGALLSFPFGPHLAAKSVA